MQHIRDDVYRLSSGREFSANRGLIGISEDGEHVVEGYDGGINCGEGFDGDPPWSPAERAELADEMIRRWTVFREGGEK